MRVLAVVLWRNVLTSGVSCRALLCNNCLFSSLFFSFFLFFSPCEKKGNCCCWLLNPDSRAQRENQDLFVGFFFTNHLFFAKNEKRPKTSFIIIGPFFSSFDSSYINAPNTHTYKMALSMQSALAGKQITVNKVSSKRYVYLIFA